MDRCPKCGTKLDFDEVDIGEGTLRGNYRCPGCGWVEGDDEDGFDEDEDGA